MSRPFGFVFQPLLERYERTERDARAALRESQRSFDEATREAERLRQELRLHAGALQQPKDQRDLALHYGRLEHLHWVVRQQQETLSWQGERLSRLRLAFVTANTKRKTLEQLRTRRVNAYVARTQLLEERYIDESNVRVRNVAAGGH